MQEAKLVWVVMFCIAMMIGSGLLSVVGRGMISIVLGVLGVLFSIEGMWAAVNYQDQSLRLFVKFLGVYALTNLAVGGVFLETIDEFCITAEEDEMSDCNAVAELYAICLMCSAIFIVFGIILICVFYRSIDHHGELTPFERRYTILRDSILSRNETVTKK